MKKTTYRMQLNDGKHTSVEANSAAEAIEDARWLHRGRTVIECHSGLTETEAHNLNLIDVTRRAMPGYIVHDVPAHDPIPESATKAVRRKLKDETGVMFSDTEMSGGRLAS